jgi:hypothetical protein
VANPSGPFQEAWEQLTALARDDSLLGGGYDQPLLALLDATRETTLRRFFPFTSLNRPCFVRSPWPFEDIQPAFVEFYKNGTYIVLSGGPYTGPGPPVELKTTEPGAAVAAVGRLLGLE